MQYLWHYLFLINAAAVLLMLADKQRARKKRWRIPESLLLGTALLGGSVGAVLGMLAFSHKTKHRKFCIGLPVILGVQLLAGICLFR